jgi:hypothetical protein
MEIEEDLTVNEVGVKARSKKEMYKFLELE